ncbi:hypothetical protein SAMN04489761_2672 [Tenacibaculum sp. MAR_2009_124]|nr:hypothetical protein SAMN04489761_2672 [Tenacibaculum sp. MAR_2009_124]
MEEVDGMDIADNKVLDAVTMFKVTESSVMLDDVVDLDAFGINQSIFIFMN